MSDDYEIAQVKDEYAMERLDIVRGREGGHAPALPRAGRSIENMNTLTSEVAEVGDSFEEYLTEGRAGACPPSQPLTIRRPFGVQTFNHSKVL